MTYKKCIAFIYSLCVHVWSRATVHLWTLEDNFQESVLSFYHVGPRNGTWVIRLGNMCLHLMNHLINPGVTFKLYLSILQPLT